MVIQARNISAAGSIKFNPIPEPIAPVQTVWDYDFTTFDSWISGKGMTAQYTLANLNAVSIDALDGATDVEVLVLTTRNFTENSDGRQRIFIRSGGTTAAADFYYAQTRGIGGTSAGVQVWKSVAGATTNLYTNTATGHHLAAVDSRRLWVRFRANGTTLSVKFWLYGEDEPGSWAWSGTDSGLASGWCGFGGNATTTARSHCIDYFSAGTSGATAPMPGESVGANQLRDDFGTYANNTFPSTWTPRYVASTGTNTYKVFDQLTTLVPKEWNAYWVNPGNDRSWQMNTTFNRLENATNVTTNSFLYHVPSGVFADGIISGTVWNNTSNADQGFRLHLRSQAPAIQTRQAYVFLGKISSNVVEIAKYTSPTTFTVLADTSFTLETVTDYNMKFEAVGTTLRGKIWLASDAEPGSWTLTTTDSDYASGRAGVGKTSSSTTRWDTIRIEKYL